MAVNVEHSGGEGEDPLIELIDGTSDLAKNAEDVLRVERFLNASNYNPLERILARKGQRL